MPAKRKVLGLVLVFMLMVTGIVSAHEIIQGDQCGIAAEEIISGDVFVLCRDLVMAGKIEGNLYGAAATAVISGEITGDVYLLAGQLEVTATIQKTLHFGGGFLALLDETHIEDGGLVNLNLSTSIAPQATIPDSIVQVGYQLILDGNVSRDISFWGSALTIQGAVQGDIEATVGDPLSEPGWLLETIFSLAKIPLAQPGLTISEAGVVAGELRYTSASEGTINGQLANPPQYVPAPTGPVTINLGEGDSENNLSLYLSQMIREFVSLGLIGVIGLVLAPRTLQAPIQYLRQHPFTSLGVGVPAFFIPLIMLFVVAILTLLVMLILWLVRLTDLALVAGVIATLSNITGTSLYYFVAIFVARVIVCLALGQFIVRLAVGDDGSQRVLFISLFSGVFALAVLSSLPVIGWVFNAIALALGLGAILIMLQNRLRTMRERTLVPSPYSAHYIVNKQLSTRPESVRQLPPPILDDTHKSPGMENLPEGFDWWGEDDETKS